MERAGAFGAELVPPLDRMILAMLRRQRERAWTDGTVETIERVLEEMGLDASDRQTAFAFVDLAGYTRITDERGDEAGARLAQEMGTMVDRSVTARGGTPVKWLGDGVMVHFRDPEVAVRATLEIVDRAPAVGLPAHAGIAAYAGPGSTLVSGRVTAVVEVADLSFDPVGPVELKGFADPVHLFEARFEA